MSAWYAHSLDGHPETDWEAQPVHASAVGETARRRGAKFGLADLAAAAGFVHDLGKYQPEFMGLLRGTASKGPDHSSAGAVYAVDHWGRPGLLIAHAVAGHHAGLKDALFTSGGRIERYRPKLAPIMARALTDGFSLPAPPKPGAFNPVPGEEGFQLAFLTRMLLSCLVDADRTATETFMGGVTADRVFAATPADLAAELARFMDRSAEARRARGEDATPLNRLRSEVLHAVAARAVDPQGIFTLTVPTGGGKTLTSLRFALDHAKAHQLDRVIIVIPFAQGRGSKHRDWCRAKSPTYRPSRRGADRNRKLGGRS